MKQIHRPIDTFILGCVFLGALACTPQASVESQAKEAVASASAIQKTKALSKLVSAKIGLHQIQLELAITDAETQKGLMFRETMPLNQGMLFVFKKEQPLSFWMKNTLIPLSIAYLNKEFKIVDIQKMAPKDLTPHPSLKPAQYALEMNQGWFKDNKVKVGDALELSSLDLIN